MAELLRTSSPDLLHVVFALIGLGVGLLATLALNARRMSAGVREVLAASRARRARRARA